MSSHPAPGMAPAPAPASAPAPAAAPAKVAPAPLPAGVVIVTGCTQGLGYQCVLSLARIKAAPAPLIVMACRNTKAAAAAADAIAKKAGCSRERLVVLPEPCDLADNGAVRVYAAALTAWLEGRQLCVQALVNNAGIGGSAAFNKNAAGHDMVFASNHLGHFLLTLLLLPKLSPHGRIINVASEVHDPATNTGTPDPRTQWPSTPELYHSRLLLGEPLDGESGWTSGSRRYSRSKACNVMFTFELAARLSGTPPYGLDAEAEAAAAALPSVNTCTLPAARQLSVLAMNPGLMLDSHFVSSLAGPIMGTLAWLLQPLLRLTPLGRLLRSTPVSGLVLANLAVGPLPSAASPGSPGCRTCYFDGPAVTPSSEFTRLPPFTQQQELWSHSVRWAELTTQELAAAGMAAK